MSLKLERRPKRLRSSVWAFVFHSFQESAIYAHGITHAICLMSMVLGSVVHSRCGLMLIRAGHSAKLFDRVACLSGRSISECFQLRFSTRIV